MIQLLVALLVLLLIISIVFWILSMLPLPAPWVNIARLIVALILLILVLQYFGLFGAGHYHL